MREIITANGSGADIARRARILVFKASVRAEIGRYNNSLGWLTFSVGVFICFWEIGAAGGFSIPAVYYHVCAALCSVSAIVALWVNRQARQCPLEETMKQLRASIESSNKHDCHLLFEAVRTTPRRSLSWKRSRFKTIISELDLFEERLQVLELAYDLICCKGSLHSDLMKECRATLAKSYERLVEVNKLLLPQEIAEKAARDREAELMRQRIERESDPEYQQAKLEAEARARSSSEAERHEARQKIVDAKLRAYGLSDEQLGIVSDDTFDKLLG